MSWSASTKVMPVTGQDQAWEPSNNRLKENLGKCFDYMCKSLPAPLSSFRLADRVEGSGVLLKIWDGKTIRRCGHCRQQLAPERFSHSKWCSTRCRVAACRERRKTADASGPPAA